MAASLIGRDDELEHLDALIDRARRHRGTALELRGPAGIGKSALLDELARRADTGGLMVLRARGAERTRDVSFGVVHALFGALVAGFGPTARAASFSGAARLAEPVLSGRAGGPPPSSDVGFARRQGLYWLTANLAQRRPLALVVDDLQWVDAPSRGYLAELAERLDGLPVLVVAAVREETGDARATTDGVSLPGEQRRLTPLTDAQVVDLLTRLVGAPPSDAVADRAVRVTGGNPYLVHELARSLAGPNPAGAGAPAAAFARLTAVGPDARALAEALAVLGTDADADTLVALADVAPERVAGGFAELHAAGLVESAGPTRFVHPLVHAAVDEGLEEPDRRRLHGRAARLLADRGEDAELVAVHLLASGPEGGEQSVRILRAAAAEAMAGGAPDRAAELYRRAVDLVAPAEGVDATVATPGDGRPAVPPELLLELGAAQAAAGAREPALATLRGALAGASDPVDAVRAARALAALLTLDRATAAEAVEVLSDALVRLPAEERELGVLLEADIETAAFVSLAAREVAGRRETSVFADPDHRQILAATAMHVAMETGPASTAAEHALRALDGGRLLAEEGPESPTFWLAALALIFSQDLLGADAVLRAADDDASARGSRVGAGMVACFRSCLDLSLGRVGDAEVAARRFLELTPTAFGLGPAFLVQALLERGRTDDARRALTDGPEPDLDSAMAHFLMRSRAAVHRATGDLEAAERDLRALAAGAQEWQTRMPGPLLADPMLIEVLHARGAADEAREVLDRTLASCETFGADSCTGTVLRTAAAVADDPDAGLALIRRSVGLLSGTPARLEHARSLVALGRLHIGRGELREARDPLRRGLQLARRGGATALALSAHEGLTATGLRPRKIVTGGLDSLTASERRVCALVADGMTSREVAEHLFVTVRTVETHLDRSFKKLGIHRRTELRRALDVDRSGR